MEYSWTSQFEGYPTNADFGSVMGAVTRDIKGAFKERFENEHSFDESSSPIVSHKVGECKVVMIHSDDPTSQLIDNAVAAKGDTLYRDNGSVLEAVGAASHLNLDGTSDHDHDQFFRSNGADNIEGSFSVPDIINLPTDEYESDSRVLPKAHETQESNDGGARHTQGSASRDLANFGVDYMDYSDEKITIEDEVTHNSNYEIDLHEFSSMLTLTYAEHEDGSEDEDANVTLLCTKSNYDDYVGRAAICAGFPKSGRDLINIELEYRRLL